MIEARDIHVTGIVQGVGFRPFIYRLAKRYLVNGWVLNATDGVFIHAEGEENLLDEFILEISQNPPAASRVDRIEIDYVPLQDFSSFDIRFSDEAEVEKTTLVSPDLATCDDCLSELFDESDRRYHYPFINCTNCGPRFTIIDALPYDRPSTSMAGFPMCESCAAEYADPADRRFHAQPDACFSCGPRLSLRVSDAYKKFVSAEVAPAAPATADESALSDSAAPAESTTADPAAPSSHAEVMWAETRESSDAIIDSTVAILRAGGIVAIKGLGGFHLACDASNAETLAELRRRKRREGKAFAVMVRDVEAAHHYCIVSEEEENLLTSAARPIVLLRKRPDVSLASGLADDLPELGIMLPATPVQHLLLRAFDGMLVMTSGNVHDEPIQIDDEQAYTALADIADAFVGNNRPIRARYDDSVVRVLDVGNGETMMQFIRRARGYAPLPIVLPDAPFVEAGRDGDVSTASASASTVQSIFATGPEQKCTFCLTRPGEAFVSQHIGDMENAETNDAWLEAKRTYESLLQITPDMIACDLHPEYLTSKWAHAQASRQEAVRPTESCDALESTSATKGTIHPDAQSGIQLVRVQHHHAHIVSAMAENGLSEAVCGIAFDGTGYGVDGALWGGEVLLSNTRAFERFANFAYIPLPGGAAAIKHPLRCAYGALWAFDLLDHPGAQSALDALGEEAALCEQMIENNLNTPYSSSVGRLFDAASALLGICIEPTYEGEGAVLLEAAMTPTTSGAPTIAQDHTTQANSSTPTSANAPTATQGQATQERSTLTSTPYTIDFVKNTASKDSTAQDTSVVLLDAAPAFKALLDDKAAGVDVATIAQRFHDAISDAIVQVATLVEAAYDIHTVVLSGGVFMNRYLMQRTIPALAKAGFTVAVNKDLPPNDACISFGQAVVAWHTRNDNSI